MFKFDWPKVTCRRLAADLPRTVLGIVASGDTCLHVFAFTSHAPFLSRGESFLCREERQSAAAQGWGIGGVVRLRSYLHLQLCFCAGGHSGMGKRLLEGDLRYRYLQHMFASRGVQSSMKHPLLLI